MSQLPRSRKPGERKESSNRGAYAEVEQADGNPVEMERLSHDNPGRLDESKDDGDTSDGDDLVKSSMPISSAPTEAEKKSLRKVPDKVPWSAFLVAVVEMCERFAFYGLSGPFQNYISNKYHDPSGLPGALGLSQARATALTNFFQAWCYFTPIIGAIIADQYLGKYLTIVYFSLIYMVGILVLFVTSLPYSIENGYALGGLVAAMIIIGFGTGGIKSNVGPLIAEQYQGTKPFVKTLSSGERVIVDPNVTIQRIMMIFYMCINVGSLASLATTSLEKYVGFWSAYLLPLFMFIVGFAALVAGRKKYVIKPPKGGIMTHCFRALWIAILNKGNLDAAKPSRKQSLRGSWKTPWDDGFIDELKRALVACKVFLFFPIYWMVYNQMLNNFISQAGKMELHGIPNDIMQNIDPITIILLIPLMDRIFYPALRRVHISFLPITRIAWGFLLASLAMAYAAFVQKLIYSAPPCFDAPSACPEGLMSNGESYSPNEVHVMVQAPAYVLIAVSEIFASVTGIEYAYTKAPASMKSFIMSMFLLTSAFGAALGMAISPSARDPYLVMMYVGLAVTCAVAGVLFWCFYKRYNKFEESMNDLGEEKENLRRKLSIDVEDRGGEDAQGLLAGRENA